MLLHVLVYLPLLFPLPAALGARPLAERLDPRWATWLLTGCALALAALSCAALGVLAVAGVVRLEPAGWLGGWSAGTVRAHDSVSLPESVLAGLALAAACAAGGRIVWRRSRSLLGAALDAACLPGPDQVVVVPDRYPDAFALPGLPGRVVVSSGMLDALDARDREAMLAHERAHLACHHYAFVALVHLAAAVNPLLRPAATAVAYTVERWADERAAEECGDRRQVARAVGKAALATSRSSAPRRLPQAVLGLLGLPRRAAGDRPGPVPRRVAALLAPPPAHHPLTGPVLAAATATVFVGVNAVCAFAAAHDLHHLLELAGAH
jgi:Zn-dependent protease with chaperone function